jgi:hypothetical protein
MRTAILRSIHLQKRVTAVVPSLRDGAMLLAYLLFPDPLHKVVDGEEGQRDTEAPPKPAAHVTVRKHPQVGGRIQNDD